VSPWTQATSAVDEYARYAAAVNAVYAAHHGQGLTLVHFSAQLKRILWDRGAFRGDLVGD
jgi:hypothetical protein